MELFNGCFNHSCKRADNILFIIESEYGNDAYVFYFKLKELLYSYDFYIDCRCPFNWELLLARTSLSDKLCHEILCTLARLGFIDEDTWREDGIIFISLEKQLDMIEILH